MDPPDPEYVLRGFDAPVTCVTFLERCSARQRDLLLAGTEAGSIYCWDLHRRRIVYHDATAHSNTVLSITVVDDGLPEVISQGREGVTYRWQIDDDKIGTKLGVYFIAEMSCHVYRSFCKIL